MLSFPPLNNKNYVLKAINGSWRKGTVCLDWNIGIIHAELKHLIEMNKTDREYFKIDNTKCYYLPKTLNSGDSITLELYYEILSEDMLKNINLTVLDMARDSENIGNGLFSYVFDVNGKDLGGLNQVFQLV